MESTDNARGRIRGPKGPLAFLAMTTVFMATIDMSIVMVALPWIRGSIGATLEETSWFVGAYLIANLCMIPLSGFFQRRFGYRWVLSRSLFVFTASSLLCAFAWSTPSMIVGRMLQGFGGGLMMPTSDALLLERFSHEERGLAIGLTTIGRIGGPLLGPVLGGWLVDAFGWHLLFLINLPIGALLIVLSLVLIREDRTDVAIPPVDGTSILLLFAWLIPLQIVLEEGQRQQWLKSPWIQLSVGVAAVSLLVWIGRSLAIREAPVRLRLLGSSRLAACTMISFLSGACLFAALYLFNLYCGERLGYSARQTGMVLAMAAACQVAATLLCARWVRRVDPLWLMGGGILLMILSLYEYTGLTGAEGTWQLLLPQILRAVGTVMVVVSNRTLAFESVEPAAIGDVNGLLNFALELGGAVAIATSAAVVSRQVAFHNAALELFISPFALHVQEVFIGASHRSGLSALSERVGSQALAAAFSDSYSLLSLAAVAMLLSMVWLHYGRADQSEPSRRPA